MQIHGRSYVAAATLIRTWVVVLDRCILTVLTAMVAVALLFGLALPCPTE
jgi:hypothetical protein